MSANSGTKPWEIRAVQLDLARQREPVEKICEFIEFAAGWGYNTLLLYLEGLVRTESFPFRPEELSYSKADMLQIVERAARHGMDVIPCIETLNYAEKFVSCRELRHLEEICDDPSNPGGFMFCPSNPETYEFLSRYLADIAAIFPSQHLHVGCDETFKLGTCPKCKPRAEEEGLQGLFVEHVKRIREIAQGLGKRIWIWDDMLEFMPDSAVEAIPRDVVMCQWHYDAEGIDLDGVQGHFNNLDRKDWLALYEKLGFDAVVCPCPRKGVENTVAFTNYGRQHRVLGGLQTVWEMHRCFLAELLPGIALSGFMWSNPGMHGDVALDQVLSRLFPNVDDNLRMVIRAVIGEQLWSWERMDTPERFLRGPLTANESRTLNSLTFFEKLLAERDEQSLSALERDILEDLHVVTRENVLYCRLRQLLPEIVDPRYKVADYAYQKERADWCRSEIHALADIRAAQWLRYREGLQPDGASTKFNDMAERLEPILSRAGKKPDSNTALIVLKLFLWDAYSWPVLKVELGAGSTWQAVFSGSVKPLDMRMSHYTVQIPITWDGEAPDAIRFTVSGYGGQGFSYAGVCFEDYTLVPSEVTETSGDVRDSEALLVDNSWVCYLGSIDTTRTFLQKSGSRESSITLSMSG